MDLKKLISEEINLYMSKNIVKEDSEPDNEFAKQQKHAKVRDGENVSYSDETQIRHEVNKDDLINVAALARKVYPDHTPEGAQSQLRKKLKGLTNDNGSEYHIKEREASTIRKALNT